MIVKERNSSEQIFCLLIIRGDNVCIKEGLLSTILTLNIGFKSANKLLFYKINIFSMLIIPSMTFIQ